MVSRNKMLAVALVILVLVAVPYTRNILKYQIAVSVYPNVMSHSFARNDDNRTTARDAQDALAIAKREGSKAKSVNAYWKVIERYPNEPALYANMLRYASHWTLRSTRRPDEDEIRKGVPAWKPAPPSSELDKIARAIEMGKKLEPDNAYFDLYEAILRFNQGRDPEGLAAIHRAAGKKEFEDHVFDELDATIQNQRERTPKPLYSLNPISRIAQACSVLLPHYMHFRSAARVAGDYIEQDMRQGKRDEALATATDVINLGILMREKSQTNIGVLVGIAIHNTAVLYAYKGLDGPEIDTELTNVERLSKLQALIPNGFSSSQWKALHDSFARSDEWRTRMRLFSRQDWDRTFRSAMLSAALISGGGLMLIFIILLGLIWGISMVWLKKRGQAGITGVEPSKLSVWLLAALSPAIVLMFISFMRMQLQFYPPTSGPDFPFGTAIILLTIFSPLGVIIVAAARTRLAPEVGRFNTFLARLRTGSVYAMQALVVLYLLTMIADIPISIHSNRVADTFFRTETQQIWEYELPAKGK